MAAALTGMVLGHATAMFGTTPQRSDDTDPRSYGIPHAELFQEDYAGPPMTGDAVTRLPHLAPLGAGTGVHNVRIDVVAQRIEIAEGVQYDAWTFGGTVPGPVVHVREGDRVVFTMKNRSGDLVSVSEPVRDSAAALVHAGPAHHGGGGAVAVPMPHSIDFHAAMVAPEDKYRSVRPGQSIRFEWVANYPGVYLYHCGTPPLLQHVALGQYGIVVVSPRAGYPTEGEVARRYAVVQSEFYLKPGPNGVHVLDWEAAQQKRPSHVVFNGHADALKKAPLAAIAGERVRLYLHNVGPNDTASSHVVGTIFDRVWYEGNPANAWRGMQTVLLGASSGAVVEFVVPEPGDYILVDHEFADAQKGAVGRIRAQPQAGTLTRVLPGMAH